jgi:hypothetical protein
MFSKTAAALLSLLLSVGCGGSSTPPSPDPIDPFLGMWIAERTDPNITRVQIVHEGDVLVVRCGGLYPC